MFNSASRSPGEGGLGVADRLRLHGDFVTLAALQAGSPGTPRDGTASSPASVFGFNFAMEIIDPELDLGDVLVGQAHPPSRSGHASGRYASRPRGPVPSLRTSTLGCVQGDLRPVGRACRACAASFKGCEVEEAASRRQFRSILTAFREILSWELPPVSTLCPKYARSPVLERIGNAEIPPIQHCWMSIGPLQLICRSASEPRANRIIMA